MLGKVSDVGVRLTAGVGEVPVPVRDTVCGEPVALSVTPTEAVSAPGAFGEKLTVMTQELLAVRVAVQVLVCENELTLAPVIEMLLMFRSPFPVFLRVTGCVAAEEPTSVAVKVSAPGDRLTAGASTVIVAVPVVEA